MGSITTSESEREVIVRTGAGVVTTVSLRDSSSRRTTALVGMALQVVDVAAGALVVAGVLEELVTVEGLDVVAVEEPMEGHLLALEEEVDIGPLTWAVTVGDVPLPDDTLLAKDVALDVTTDALDVAALETPVGGDTGQLALAHLTPDLVGTQLRAGGGLAALGAL